MLLGRLITQEISYDGVTLLVLFLQGAAVETMVANDLKVSNILQSSDNFAVNV